MHARCVREDTKQALKGNLQADGVQSRQTLFVRYCLYLMWNYIYNPVEGLIQQTASGLQMHGNEVSLWEDAPKAWLGRRQEHFCCTV